MKRSLRYFAVLLVSCGLRAAPAAADSQISISFVAAAFYTLNDYQIISTTSYISTKLRLDSYMEGAIGENGFVFINGNLSLVRVTDGEIVSRTKLGFGNGQCDGHFLYEKSAVPSSVELVKKVGRVAHVRVRTPQLLSGYHDRAAPSLCQEPKIGILSVNSDGSPGPNSEVTFHFTPTGFASDGPYAGDNMFNHYSYAEFPINIDKPEGRHYFSFVQNAKTFDNGLTATAQKTVWFGTVTVRRDQNPAAAEDGYTQNGYSPESDPSKPPKDPPNPDGSTPNKGETTDWMKEDILQLIKNGFNTIRSALGGPKSGRLPNGAKPFIFSGNAEESEVNGGVVTYDAALNSAQFASAAAAPAAGTLSISAVFTKIKTGKVSKIKLPAAAAVAGTGTLIDAQNSKKLFALLRSKGAYRVALSASLKPTGGKAIKTGLSFKLK